MDLRSMMARMGGGGMSPEGLSLNLPDSSETVHISSMALLKMLKHGSFLFLFFSLCFLIQSFRLGYEMNTAM